MSFDYSKKSSKGIEGHNEGQGDSQLQRHSGHGILQFSTEKAGLDVTPANFFASDKSAFQSVAGEVAECYHDNDNDADDSIIAVFVIIKNVTGLA